MAGPKQNEPHPFDNFSDDRAGYERTPRKRRRWPWLLLLLLVVVFFLPNVIAMTGLKQKAIDYALADFNGRITVKSASFGWLQPTTLKQIEAVDEAGRPLATIEEVKTSGSLISFLTSSDYGTIEVNQPAVWLQLRPDGSNLEDACAAWLEPADHNDVADSQKSAADDNIRLPKVELNINNGTVAVFSMDETQSWQVEQLNAKANTNHQLAAVVADTNCQVTVYNGPPGGQMVAQNSGVIQMNVQVDPGSPVLSGGSIASTLQTDGLPLSIVGPILQRFLGPTETDGLLTADLEAAVDISTGHAQVAIKQANAVNLIVSAPELIGSDEIRIKNVTAVGNLTADPARVSADQFQVVSDFANVSANGTLDLNHLAGLADSTATVENVSLLNTPFQLGGEIDLAGVAATFPATLHLHDGLKIESGSVNFQAASRVENEIRRLIVNVDTANLVARDQGQPIIWQKPLRLVGTIREGSTGLMLEEVLCESDFLTVSGTANRETGSFSARGDLARLLQRVSQFADVGQTVIAGGLDGKLAWQTESPDNTGGARPVQLVGEFIIDQPRFQLPGMVAWQRPELTMRMSAAGHAISDQAVRLDQAGVQLDIGTEQVLATLAEPVANAFAQSTWKMNTQLSGSAAGWLAHAKNFVDLGDIRADGQIQGQAVAHLNPDAIEIHGGQYEIQQLEFDGYGLTIREQQTTGTAAARYDLNSGQLVIAETVLSSNSISLSGQQVAVDIADNIQINGDVAFRANMNRIADWIQLSPTQDSVFWFGDGEGTIRFLSDANGIGATISSSVDNMIAATRQSGSGGSIAQANAGRQPGVQTVSNSTSWMELWREAKVDVASQIKLSNDFESVTFENTSLQSSTMQANLTGQLSELSGAMVADVRGNWTPNWQKLNALLAAYTGEMVQMAGQGTYPVSVRGPLFEPISAGASNGQAAPWVSPLLTAATGFDWQQATLAGMPIGPGQIKIDLQQGIANVLTNDISFSNGSVQLKPQIDLRGSEPVLYLPAGKMINQVALTPETARTWLAYVAPLAADATSAQGTFSLATQGAQIPLMDPMKMKAQGELTLSNIVIGAGPTAEKLLATATQLHTMIDPESANKQRDLKTWLTLDEQTVPVAIENGRVFHEGIRISHKDVIVETRGSVGLDQSLDLIAEIPIADDWIAGKDHLAGLRGQKISIPVTGTAAAPKLDMSAINQVSSQLIRQAANGAVNKFIGDKVAPKVTEYQNQISDRVSQEANKFQNKLQNQIQNKLLDKIVPQSSGQTGGQTGGSTEDNLKGELLKGIGNLFGK
jgi:hypothetical protein